MLSVVLNGCLGFCVVVGYTFCLYFAPVYRLARKIVSEI